MAGLDYIAKAAPAGGAAVGETIAATAGALVITAAEPAIPVKEIPARTRFTRTFVRDKKNLQREQKKGVSPALTVGAYLIVLGTFVGLIASLAWGLMRFARREAPVTSS